ncbi:MAG: hypothetical protein ACK4ND_14115 [Cytophagaceae bacterium]
MLVSSQAFQHSHFNPVCGDKRRLGKNKERERRAEKEREKGEWGAEKESGERERWGCERNQFKNSLAYPSCVGMF